MADLDARHLRAAPAAGARHGTADRVEHVHERQRPGGRCAGAGNVRAAWPERREVVADAAAGIGRSEEHTSELQSLMRISYAVFCLTKKKKTHHKLNTHVVSY